MCLAPPLFREATHEVVESTRDVDGDEGREESRDEREVNSLLIDGGVVPDKGLALSRDL